MTDDVRKTGDLQKTISIALLVAGEPPKKTAEKIGGGFDIMFRNTLAEALSKIPRHEWHPKVSLHIQAFNVQEAEFPDLAQLDDGLWDAIIVTGSANSALDENVVWIEVLSKYLVHLVHEHPLVRIIGVGFGHQLIARAFGGQVVHDQAHAELGVTQFHLTEEGTNLLSPFDRDTEWGLEQVHIDRVAQMPPPVEGDPWICIGGNEACEIQGMVLHYPSEAPPLPSTVKTSSYVAFDVDDSTTGSAGPLAIRNAHILTLQGHPEYNALVTKDLLTVLHESRTIDDQAFEKGYADATLEQRGHDTSKIVLGMLGVEPAIGELDPMSLT